MLCGIIIHVRDEHNANAQLPIHITLSGIVIVVSDEQSKNASFQIE